MKDLLHIERKGLSEIDLDNDDDIINFAYSRWQAKENVFGGLYKKWLETIAAYQGFYHLDYNVATRRFINKSRDVPSWRVNLAINLLLPRIRSQVSKLLRTRPIFDVIPASSDIEDIEIAGTGKSSLRGFWYKNNFNYKFVDLLYWLALTGNAFSNPIWNPFMGDLKQLSPTDFLDVDQLRQAAQNLDEEAVLAAQQQAEDGFRNFVKQNGGDDSIFLGELDWDIPSPFDVIFPTNGSFDKKEWLIRGQIRSKSFYLDLGIDEDELKLADPADKRYLTLNRRISSSNYLSGIGSLSDQIAENIDDDDVLELHLWLPSTERRKKGFFAAIAGGKVIRKGDNPYNHRKIPYVHFVAEKVPGKIHGFSAGGEALPEIKAYNEHKSRIVEISKVMANPIWMVPDSAQIGKRVITTEPGQVLRYKGNREPTRAKAPEVPRVFSELMGSAIRDIDEITAQRESTRGINPAGGRSAAVVQTLQATDEGSLAIIGLVFDTGIGETGSMFLSILDQFVSEDRLISFVGEKNKHIVKTLKTGSLQGENKGLPGANYFNVRVTTFSQFGLDRQGQQSTLTALLQHNVFKPEDREKIMKWLDMGWFEDEIDEFKIDRSMAHRENLRLAQGEDIGVTDEQHHATHKAEHKIYMNGEDFLKLDSEIQQKFRQHLFMTEFMEVKAVVKPQVFAQFAQMLSVAEVQQKLGLPLPPITGNENGPSKSTNKQTQTA